MKHTILLKVPAIESYFNLVSNTIVSLSKDLHFSQIQTKQIINAIYELFLNAITHAYSQQEGLIEIVFHPFDYGLRIDVHDWGMPMESTKYSSVPINLSEDKGFNRVYKLVDKFEYVNLGKNGKKFSIIKYLKPYQKRNKHDLSHQIHNQPLHKINQNIDITIRDYEKGDEEYISKLIYQNYGNSYVKELFYYPKKIREYENKTIFSIVALIQKQLIGHFALVKKEDSNIAEIGVVVVDPRYKGHGIMNKMFDALIEKAKKLKFNAIFGEAIMYHVFSQKSNLSHGFFESALMLGKAPADISIENNQLSQKKRRGSVLVGYKVFHYPKQELILPKLYRDMIMKTYQQLKFPITFTSSKSIKETSHLHLYYRYEPLENTATIVIESYAKHFKHKFLLLLNQLRAKHCDMIYAHINLNNLIQIDKVIKILNNRGFFYCGILFLEHKNQDYLCLQNKHSIHIGKKNLLCYSDFCKNLLAYIYKDEQRIK